MSPRKRPVRNASKSKRRQRVSARNRLGMSDASYSLRYLPTFDAGASLTNDEALKVSAVWGCIDVITRALAPAPWRVYEVVGRQRESRPNDALWYLLNTRPNPSTTAIAFREALSWGCMGSGGNGYAEIQWDNAGRPVALWPLEPDRVTPHTDGQGGIFYRVFQYSGGQVDVEASRILHIRGPSISGFVGDNVLYRASTEIAIARASAQFAASYFANGTVSSGVLKFPKKLSPPTIARLREEWVQSHAGRGTSHAPLFLEEGMDWQSISVDAEKSQLTETREFGIAQIARYFGVPLHKLQVAQSAQGYGTNIEQMGIEFVRDTLLPWCERYEQEIDFKLIADRSRRETHIDLSHLTMGDYKTRMEGHSIAKRAGILNQNDVLEMEGRNTIGPEGDVYLVESAMTTLDRMIDPPEPPAPVRPALPPPDEDEEDDGDEAMNTAALEAVALVFAASLERYARVLQNRRADVGRQAPEKVEANLAAERDRLRPRLVEECAPAVGILHRIGGKVEAAPVLLEVASAVEQGEPPQKAAERLVTLLCADPVHDPGDHAPVTRSQA